MEEVTNIDKDVNESFVPISYKIKFIDKARFMENSLSNLVDNRIKLNVEIMIVFLNIKVFKRLR